MLYGHFPGGKAGIVDAVALQGIGELAGALEAAAAAESDPAAALTALAAAYTGFAAANPALYEAMFTMTTSLSFGTEDSPPELVRAFTALYRVLAPLSGAADPETYVETAWAALHGLVLLTRGGRLRPGLEQQRLAVLVDRLLLG